MKNYYEILELPRSADATQIRTAFKRLAMQYHPDRNPGNKQAEEVFKIVNEAYHTLSDPLKKSRYDDRLFSSSRTAEHTHEYWREAQQRRYRQWKQAQTPGYRFDKHYFKIQGLAFLAFLIIGGFSFGTIHTIYYFVGKYQEAQWKEHTVKLKEVNTLFKNGQYEDAFGMIDKLKAEDVREYRYSYALDSLVDELRHLSDTEFENHDFSTALKHYHVLQLHEHLPRLETLEKIAACQYYVGNYTESIQTFKHVLHQQPWRIDLIYEIGSINMEKINNREEALFYFTMGKKLFKKTMSEAYGDAFEIVLNPADVPDIYYSIFQERAKVNLELLNFKEAITDCNYAIYLRPNKGISYSLRAQARAGAQEYQGICDDITNALRLGADPPTNLRQKYCR